MGGLARSLAAAAIALAAWTAGGEAAASCYPVARAPGGYMPASFRIAAVKANHVRIEFVGHSTFTIDRRKGCGSPPTTTTMSARRCCRPS